MDINKLLGGVNCNCRKHHTCDIKYVYIENDAAKNLSEICRDNHSVLIVADENTFQAAGEITLSALKGKNIKKLIFSGNYGMQYGVYNKKTKAIDITRDISVNCDKLQVTAKINLLREKYGFTNYTGETVEFHPSGCVTFPLLGTKAKQEDKLAFDPDRTKRRKIYDHVVNTFSDYCIFVGGSSSFDMAPKPYDKSYALDLYCKENGYTHDDVVYIGDDYGLGGNDEAVYKSDYHYIEIDNYLDFPQKVNIFM